MQIQVKILCCLALLMPMYSKAQSAQWESLKSNKINIQEFSSAQGEVISSYIPYFNTLGRSFWEWDPKEEPKNTSDPVLRKKENAINETMKSLFVKFDLSDTNKFRKVWFQLTEKIKVRGLFGLHTDNKQRPLIILRMGVHGNVDEFIAERFLAKLIYENLDADFLAIESLTSHAFLTINHVASMGGVDEGIQTFLIINEIMKTAFAKNIKDIHIVSVSMGSHGTFVAAMLDQVNGHKIKSILNFCPLINLQETFASHLQPNLQNMLVDFWNVRRLRAVFTIFPQRAEINDWWESLFDLKPRFTSGILQILQEQRRAPLITTSEVELSINKMKWPPGFKQHLENSGSFYDLNNFWKYYKNIKTPMMIYTTPNDPLVKNELNSEKIFRGLQEGDFSHLHYLRLDEGVHCGLASVYQWDYIEKLFREGLIL